MRYSCKQCMRYYACATAMLQASRHGQASTHGRDESGHEEASSSAMGRRKGPPTRAAAAGAALPQLSTRPLAASVTSRLWHVGRGWAPGMATGTGADACRACACAHTHSRRCSTCACAHTHSRGCSTCACAHTHSRGCSTCACARRQHTHGHSIPCVRIDPAVLIQTMTLRLRVGAATLERRVPGASSQVSPWLACFKPSVLQAKASQASRPRRARQAPPSRPRRGRRGGADLAM
jgi:hypothetical protein